MDDGIIVILADGTLRKLAPDEIVPDGARVRRPLILMDEAAPEAGSSIESTFDLLPREFSAKRHRLQTEIGASDAMRVEQAVSNVEGLARQVERIADGDMQGYFDLDPTTAKAAAKRVSEYLQGLAQAGRIRSAALRDRPLQREPATREEAHAAMRERLRTAWRAGR